jgi:CelD/BcsL family acetyltransferase involved in cellulose biosynthesis
MSSFNTHEQSAPRGRPSGHAPLTYTVLRQLSQIEAVAPQWDALLEHTPCNRAFGSSKWFTAACRMASATPYVIVARRGETPAGVFPLVLTNEREAAFPGELSDYNDIIARPDDDVVLTGLLTDALTPSKDYSSLILKCIRPDSNLRRALEQTKSQRDSVEPFVAKVTVCPYVRTVAGYEDYLAGRSNNFRCNLRRIRNKADRDHLEVRLLTPECFPPARLAETFLSLHHARFPLKSCFKEDNEAFVRELLPYLFIERRMVVFALFEKEKMLGIHLCMVGARSLCYWNGGFLPCAAQWSPGTLLMDAGIKQAHLMNLAEYDLMRGAEPYKAKWATATREISQLEFHRDLNG